MDTPNPSQMPPIDRTEPEKKSLGPLIAVIIILALIVVGGLYFLKERSSYTPAIPASETDITDSLRAQSDSDSLDAIEADLEYETFDNIDQGAAAIEAELQ